MRLLRPIRSLKTLIGQASEGSKGAPLRLVLVVPFILQIFAAVGLTGYLSLRNGEKAVNDVTTQLRREITARIVQHLDTHLATPDLINQANADSLSLGLLNLGDFSLLERHFWKQIQLFESVSYIQFGDEQGEFVGLQRLDDGILTYQVTEFTGKLQTYLIDNQGNRGERWKTADNFDPRIRPWYIPCAKTGKTKWTEIYTWVSPPTLAITLCQPYYDEGDTFQGILAVDFTLAQIGEFLRSLKIGKSGKTFIIERSGELVASSASEKPFIIVHEQPKRRSALESSDRLIQATAQYLTDKFNNFNQINSSEQLNFKLNGQNQFVQLTPFSDQFGLNWLIVVVVPESDFMAQINANTRTTILLCLGALLLATFLGLITSRWITKPIRHLSLASAAIASGDLNQKVEVKSVNELGILSQSFNQMAAQLKESFEQLEIRVEQRTAQLNKAKKVAEVAKEAADAANRAKSEFLANMSHELRTPLNAILGFTQVMNRDSSLTQEQQENLGIISRSGEHLLSLINDVLDMSKIEAGQMTLSENSFDLYRLLDTIEEMLQLKAESKGLQLQMELAPEVPQYVYSDSRKLRQVLINLLGNAIKFTQKGGVKLRVGREQGRQLAALEGKRQKAKGKRNNQQSTINNQQLTNNKQQTTNNKQQTTIHFEVSDTGPGIAPDELESLFDPFVQTSTGRKSQQGTGLGLPISRKFVQLMGGEIAVSTQLGRGTIFKFDIQVEPTEAADMETEKPTRRVIGLEPGQTSYRILVVDDRWENRRLLAKLLTPIGFEVSEAENGQEAIALWSSWEPHLIWMDMRMPVINGYEATQQIKSHLKGQATVIIALTASTLEEERAVVLSAGCDDFVRKPFREEVIFEKMAQYLGLRYVYEQLAPVSGQSQSVSEKLTKEALAVMPPEWLAQLHQAAAKINAKLIGELIAQIPEEHQPLAQALWEKVNNFDFDRIMNLAQQAAAL